MISPNTKIVVSRHARERMTERFDHLIPPYCSHSELLIVICKMVRNGTHMTDWKRVPFYFNSIATKNGGPGTEFVNYHGEFVFICNYDEASDRLLVVTAVKRMLYFPLAGSMAVGSAGGAKYINEAKFLAGLENDAMVEYRKRHGDTPTGLYISLKKEQEAMQRRIREDATSGAMAGLDEVLKQCINPETGLLLEGVDAKLFSKVAKLNVSIKNCYSHQTLESQLLARRKALEKMGLNTNEEDVKMYERLIEVSEYQIERVGNERARKHRDRYRTALRKLTVDKTEN